MDEFAAWVPFAAALAAFLGSHAIPARPPVRQRLVATLGKPAYLALYSAISILLLACLIQTAGSAPFVELWPFEPWQRHLPALFVPLGFALATVGLFSPNPLSLSASRRSFDPARPGILALTRHPVLLGFAFWAGAHLVPNGDLAHVLLFGTFLALAVGGMWILDKRARRRLGEGEWGRLAGRYRWLSWPGRTPWIEARLLALGLTGIALAALAARFHEFIAGVPAFP